MRVSDWLRRQAPDLKAVSPRYDAAGFSVPVLLVHGKLDRRVPLRQSQAMANALKAAGKPIPILNSRSPTMSSRGARTGWSS